MTIAKIDSDHLVWDVILYLCFRHSFACSQQLKISGSRNYPCEKRLDPRNTKEKKIPDPRNTHTKKSWIHEIPTRKIFDQQNTNKGTMALDHENHDGTRLKKFSALSLQTICYILLVGFMFDKNPRLNNKHRMT